MLLRSGKLQIDEGGFLDELQLLDFDLLLLNYFAQTGSIVAEHRHEALPLSLLPLQALLALTHLLLLLAQLLLLLAEASRVLLVQR